MKSLYLTESGLALEEGPVPQPAANELLIQVHAAGVTPTELIWYPTTHTKEGTERRRAVPGHEFSGVVTAAGRNVAGVAAGDEVYGMSDWFADGATAEYCLTTPESVAPKPAHLSHVEAASVPIGALTAWQGLFDRARMQAGERVLVHGGAGAVGIFAVQLARSQAAKVVATASPRNFDFVKGLGAEEVIDYRTDYFGRLAGSFDVVFDVVGGETLEKSWRLLKPGGRMVTIAAQSEQPTDERVKQAFFIVEPSRKQLEAIGEMLDAGKLVTEVDVVAPMGQAAAAYTLQLQGRRGRGKVVVAITP